MSFQVYKTIALNSVKIHREERTGFRLLWKHSLLLEPFLTPYYLWTKGEVYIASCYGCHLHFLLRLSCHHNGKKYGSWTSPHIPVMKQNVDFKQCPPTPPQGLFWDMDPSPCQPRDFLLNNHPYCMGYIFPLNAVGFWVAVVYFLQTQELSLTFTFRRSDSFCGWRHRLGSTHSENSTLPEPEFVPDHIHCPSALSAIMCPVHSGYFHTSSHNCTREAGKRAIAEHGCQRTHHGVRTWI